MCYATADSLPIYSLINVFRERRPRLHRRRRRRRRERERECIQRNYNWQL